MIANMKAIALALLVTGSACVAPSPLDRESDAGDRSGLEDFQGAADEFTESASPHSDQHAWLFQMIGEWDSTAEISMGPDAEPFLWETEERVRALGGTFIVAEASSKAGDDAFASMLTLGYDPVKGAFVGTWVDTMQTTMWTYEGQLDEEGRVLTLEAEGPSFEDPTKTGKYRDLWEIIDEDHKRVTSTALTPEGTWQTYLTINYHRKP